MFDREKYKNLVHYVISRAADRDGFGATKLFKILWFFEARRFVIDDDLVSGAEYVKDKYGPRPRLGYAVLDELASEGRIKKWRDRYFDRVGWRFKALRPTDPSFLSPEQRRDLDHWIKVVSEDHTAATISEESHDYGWEIARQGEPLPLHAILASRLREPDEEEREWAEEQAKALGLP